MNSTAKSFVAAGAVLLATGSILVGAMMRDRVDVGGANTFSASLSGSSFPTDGLVASRDAREVPEGDYFYEITNLLKQRYVEQITDEQKLAMGAVRGMVASLGDADTLYMDKETFQAHLNMRLGQFEGVGVQLELIFNEPPQKDARASGQPVDPAQALLGGLRIPKLTVVTVVPGGPAAKAGVRVGDYVEYVEGHWIPNAETVASFRQLQKDVAEGKVTAEELDKVRIELTKRMKKAFTPLKARDRLLTGKTGKIHVVWLRGAEKLDTVIEKAPSRLPAFAEVDGVYQVRFVPGIEKELQSLIDSDRPLVIDLRNNANGLHEPMQKCLELLAPKGTYGELKLAKRSIPFEVKIGNPNPPRLTLLVDASTRGVAEVFAEVLVEAGVAKLSGPKMAGHRILVDDCSLPDGAGFTLAVAEYQAGAK